MGQEIDTHHFQQHDWDEFAARLKAETQHLQQLFANQALSSRSGVGGFELEAWLTDKAFRPAWRNEAFLSTLNHPLATTELAQFNVELNTDPLRLQGKVFSELQLRFCDLLQQAQQTAQDLGIELLLTGILPNAQQTDFSLNAMTQENRYRALNAEFLKARQHQPVSIDISGTDRLQTHHDSLMLEAAATSFQVHLQVDAQQAHYFYNAALLASSPVMAVAGNSPFLFAKSLWQETRIPLFEQSLDTGPTQPARVSFGSGFAKQSIFECFSENQNVFPVLLPMLFEKPLERMAHLRLHNGVNWRWNRPLLGFDEDDTPHIRLEHRILPAGPSVPDMLANAAFFYGLTQAIGHELQQSPKSLMAFESAQSNFYAAAQYGLACELQWQQQKKPAKQLILEVLLPKASDGLRQLGIDPSDIEAYLGIIAARAQCGQTGAVWQQQHLKQQASFKQLLSDYVQLQRTHTPVHTWPL